MGLIQQLDLLGPAGSQVLDWMTSSGPLPPQPFCGLGCYVQAEHACRNNTYKMTGILWVFNVLI